MHHPSSSGSALLLACASLTLLLWSHVLRAGELTGPGLSPADHLVEILKNLDTLSAGFHQQSSRGDLQTGNFWLSKPNQFRLESDEPLSQTIVSDGITLWTHDRDLEQVIVSDMGHRASEIPILVFAGEPELIREQYQVERFEDSQREYFMLTPTGEGALTASLSLTFENGVPLRMTLENAMGQQTSIDLLDVNLAPAEAATFTFVMPEDVDVIDDRVVIVAPPETTTLTAP